MYLLIDNHLTPVLLIVVLDAGIEGHRVKAIIDVDPAAGDLV
jgi:hypothetical protein